MTGNFEVSLTATPNPVPVGVGQGETTINWNTGEDTEGQVYVSKDNGPEILFATGVKGSQKAPWITSGSTYEFRLYAGTSQVTLLETISVTPGSLSWEGLSNMLLSYVSNGQHFDSVAQLLARVIGACAKPEFYETYFHLWEEHGFHVTPVHFYYPIPDTRSLGDEIWQKETELVGIEMNDTFQLELLQQAFPRFRQEYDQFPMEPSGRDSSFYFNNGYFSGTDALVLYCMVRYFKPQRIIEVGSGFSSRVSSQAALINGDTELICIEPYPDMVLQSGFPGLTNLISRRVQEVDVGFFETLKAGDILFIDSSHVVTIGSDVRYLFLEVLPRLNPGVLVHVHDIFLPMEYMVSATTITGSMAKCFLSVRSMKS